MTLYDQQTAKLVEGSVKNKQNQSEMNNERLNERYKKVFFDEEWLEDWILSSLGASNDILFSKSDFRRDRSRRAVVFWAMLEYCGIPQTEICRRYGQYQSTVKGLIESVRVGNFDADRKLVVRSLEPFLPAQQVKSIR
jgi:hypothetical protein